MTLWNTAVSLLDTPNFTSGMNAPSRISPITAQRRPAYDNDSFRYVMTGADSEQPVGVPCYQWVGCRDYAGITSFPHSGSWQAQGGPAYICRGQRKRVFHNMGPLSLYFSIHAKCIFFFHSYELSSLLPKTRVVVGGFFCHFCCDKWHLTRP